MSATEVLSAAAVSMTQVRVLFGDAGSPATAADSTAFDPANWSLVPDPDSELPAYSPSVTAAESVESDGGALLTADQELTPGVLYTAIARGVSGIVVNGTDNVAAFPAYPIKSAPAGRAFDLLSFIPKINLDEDFSGDLGKFIAALQEPTNLLWDQVDRWVDILDCDVAPENFVNIMLDDLGNPFQFGEPLSLIDKRKLCRLLMAIYELKGTTPGIQAAVLFFVGLRSELIPYNGFGDKLAKASTVSGFGRLSRDPIGMDTGLASQTFRLGAGGPWEFFMKLGTVVDSEIVGSASGSHATAKQKDRARKILEVMKPAELRLAKDLLRSGAEPTQRVAIKDNGGGSVDLIMKAVANSAAHLFWEAGAAGVNQYNATTSRAATGSPPTAAGISPGSTKYWNGVGKNNVTGNTGLLSNEVTNAMVKPVVTATAGQRKIRLTWPVVAGATSYRIYRGVSTFASPCAADNAQAPIEVLNEEYEDRLESGDSRFYRVTPVKGANTFGAFPGAFASEGFFSNVVTSTAL